MWILAVAIVVLALGVLWGVRNQINGMIGVGGGVGGVGTRPVVWWYVDDGQVNSREWLDWAARSTQEPNEPYLKICQARAMDRWGKEFQVEPVIGRVAALARLGVGSEGGPSIPAGMINTPPYLWMNWCRAMFLSRLGGLWIDGSVLPVGSGSELLSRLAGADALTFGTDPDEGLGAPTGSIAAANLAAGWAAVPGHPVWTALAADLTALAGEGAQSWGAPEARRSLRTLWDRHFSGVVRVDREAEVSRDRYGVRLELDTLLGQTDWPTGSKERGLWVPLPEGRDGMERASPWLWFTRLSVEQIRESGFLWAQWANQA
jgi:hypothetical protein